MRKRKACIITNRLADAQEEICRNLYEKSISSVYDYGNKVNMPYSECFGCEASTPTIVRREYDNCALCGSGKKEKEEY